MRLDQIDSFASAHHGLIHRDHAYSLGMSRSAWYRAIATGAFEQLSPYVVRLWGSPDSFEQSVLAAVWSAGSGAMASHRTAARLWGLSRPTTDPIDVTIGGRGRCPRVDGIVLHRPSDAKDLVATEIDGIPVTRATRTLVDLGAVDRWAVLPLMAHFFATQRLTPGQVDDTVGRHSRQGRGGVVALRTALARWHGEQLPADSVLEVRVADLLAGHALPPAVFHPRIAGYEVDFLLEGTDVIIECDGWASHGLQRDQFEFDRTRDAELVAAGYRVVHVTWRQVTEAPHGVARRIRAVLAATPGSRST